MNPLVEICHAQTADDTDDEDTDNGVGGVKLIVKMMMMTM